MRSGKGQQRTSNQADGRRPSSTRDSIQQLERDRETRRQVVASKRASKAQEIANHTAAGLVGDVDFMRAIRSFRVERQDDSQEHSLPGDSKVCVCVRKRPINEKELRKNDHDIVTCHNPRIVVHNCKFRVDGITKYLDNQKFQFDHTFHEQSSTEEVYFYIVKPLVNFITTGGRATCFAYGQTGSGKTHTMVGVQEMAVRDIFAELEARSDLDDVRVYVSFFEIYGARVQDLLNGRNRLNVREDAKGQVHVTGLEEFLVSNSDDLLDMVMQGNRIRTTQATETNDTSSRSHAICQVTLKRGDGRLLGKLSLVDLAGSERGQDTKSHNRQLRTESAEINKSLLALKECIRSIASGNMHVPFRASKLTMVLRDSFVRKHTRVAMIVTVSPCSSSADHSINTLRYADRVKEKAVGAPEQHVNRQRPTSAPQSKQAEQKERGQAMMDQVPKRGGPMSQQSPIRYMSPDVELKEAQRELRERRLQAQAAESAKSLSVPEPIEVFYREPHPNSAQDFAGTPDSKDGEEDQDEALTVGDHDSDLHYLQSSLGEDGHQHIEALHRTVDCLFEEEEALLNLHMNVIQENAELLTEEGRLLQSIQGDDVVDYDIDAYAARLQEILDRKSTIIGVLQSKLASFRGKLIDEEQASQRVANMPQY